MQPMAASGGSYFFADQIFWQDVLTRAVYVLTPGYAASVEMERAFGEGRYVHAAEWLVVGLSEMFLAAFSAGGSQVINSTVRGSVIAGSSSTARGTVAATQGGTSVLGHFPEYLVRAEQLGASRFNIPAELWARMSPAQRWAANQKFLDDLVARGDQAVLTTRVGRVTVGSTLEREIQYLLNRGYQIVDDGWRLVPRN
jgi:hypothetical protein